MKAYKLTNAELSVLLRYTHAKSIPGVKVELETVDDELLDQANQQLLERGLLTRAEQPGAYHLSEDLFATVMTLAIPTQAVLVRDNVGERSMQYALTQNHIAFIIVGPTDVVVGSVEDLTELSFEAKRFLADSNDGRIAIATAVENTLAVTAGATIDQGQLVVEEQRNDFSAESLLTLLKSHMHCRVSELIQQAGQEPSE